MWSFSDNSYWVVSFAIYRRNVFKESSNITKVSFMVVKPIVQSHSHVQLFVIPWPAACQAFLSFTVSWSLLKLMSIQSMIPSNHLIFCHPILLLPSIFSSIRVFSSELALHIRCPKYWSSSFSISPSSVYSGFISLRIDWFGLFALQGLSRVFCSTTIWKHHFFGTQPSLRSNSHIPL